MDGDFGVRKRLLNLRGDFGRDIVSTPQRKGSIHLEVQLHELVEP